MNFKFRLFCLLQLRDKRRKSLDFLQAILNTGRKKLRVKERIKAITRIFNVTGTR